MDPMISLVIKVQQFEDKRIEARASWNIRELKGKLSEIYPTSTDEQKLIYSGKLLNDTVILKDVLREYEGQEAHTVHLVFTPKQQNSRLQNKYQSENDRPHSIVETSSTEMSTSELRQRRTSSTTSTTTNTVTDQQQQQTTNSANIPSNIFSAFYGNTTNGAPMDANSFLAQQYAMQTWMQQAYAQYMNQYMNIMSQSEQQPRTTVNLAFIQHSLATVATSSSPNPDTQAAAVAPQVEQPQNQPAAEPQRRFPNIIQDEQENRDWLDILYSMSRLMILLCLVYFYSSPLRCLIVILIAVSIYLYHIYRQNQNRLNNNNTNRVNLNNVDRPAAAPQPLEPRSESAERTENQQATDTAENSESVNSENEPLINVEESTTSDEPQVSLLTMMRTFVVSFVASIIPDHPAM